MEFRILGPIEVADGDRLLPLSAAGLRALLAMLLLHANEVVSVDRLLDALWPDGTAAVGCSRAPGARLSAPQGARPGRAVRRDATGGIRGRGGTERARRVPVRGARRSGGRRRAGGGGGDASGRPRPLARSRTRRRCVRGVRAAGDRTPRGAASGRPRAPARGRPRARPPRRGDRRARGARRPAPAAGAPVRPADARPVPVGPPGGGARLLPGCPCRACRRPRHRAGPGAPAARARDSAAGSDA